MSRRLVSIESQPFAENSYLLYREGSAEALAIDPGMQPELILAQLDHLGLTCTMILNTHGHVDHIAGNAALKAAFPEAPILIGAGDAAMLTDPRLNLSAAFGEPVVSPPADVRLQEGDRVAAGGFELDVLEIPGHSPGHIVFVLPGEPTWVLGGDVLFAGSIGRTDFPGGNLDQLLDGIRSKLFRLPPATVVFPGHGPSTTVGEEIAHNPFTSRRMG